jgi:hypothetical protein
VGKLERILLSNVNLPPFDSDSYPNIPISFSTATVAGNYSVTAAAVPAIAAAVPATAVADYCYSSHYFSIWAMLPLPLLL